MPDDKTFRVDNQILENVPTIFGKTRGSTQLTLPGLEQFGPFDWWTTLGCYSLIDPEAPTAPVRIKLTDFIELLDFVRTLTSADGYSFETFPSDDYARVKESLHRLFSVDVRILGDWYAGRDKKGRRKREVVDYHARILTSYAYIYPADVIPPDQLPDSKRRNINKAKTVKGEPAPPIWERIDGPRPESIEFRFSEELVQGMTRAGKNIGATVLPLRVFKLRRQIPRRDTTTVFLLFWVSRQASRNPRIRLDKLVDKANLDPKQPTRNRQTVLRSLAILQEFGVIEGFNHNEKTDMITIRKSEDWHFPRHDDDEQGELSTGSSVATYGV